MVDFLCNSFGERRGPVGVCIQSLARGRWAKSLITEQVSVCRIQRQLFDRPLVDLLNVVKVPAEKVITGKNEYGSRVPVGRY